MLVTQGFELRTRVPPEWLICRGGLGCVSGSFERSAKVVSPIPCATPFVRCPTALPKCMASMRNEQAMTNVDENVRYLDPGLRRLPRRPRRTS